MGISIYSASPVQKGTKSRLEEVKVLPAGSFFGEYALLENKPRTATTKCKEDCHFAVLEKEDFQQILSNQKEKDIFLIFVRAERSR